MDKKGVTLVALVITIIVLLILAGTTISISIGGENLFSKAMYARDTWNNAIASEQDAINNIFSYLEGQTVFSAAEKLVVNTTDENATDAEKSPYVNYIDKNGNTILCRVLYDSTSPYGIEIISNSVVASVTLGSSDTTASASQCTYSGSSTLDDAKKKAVVSYNNAVDTLNNKAKSYLDTNGIASNARSVGSNPASPNDTLECNFTARYAPFTTNGWSNNVLKSSDSNSNTDLTQMNNLGIKAAPSNSIYWLATRRTYEDMNYDNDPQGYLEFYVRSVQGNAVSSKCLLNISSRGSIASYSELCGLRAVFHLNNNVKVISGEGTETSPYNLGL